MLTSVEALESREPSAAAFAELTRLLDDLRGQPLLDALGRAEAALARWPDETRTAPDAWERIQQDQPPPPWWSLVRHVRVQNGETLDVGTALAPLTSVDASDINVDPTPLGRASRLRQLDLAGNGSVTGLRFVSGTPELERLSLARQELALDLAPLSSLRQFNALNLSFDEHFEDAQLLANLKGLKWLDLTATSCGGTLSALAALPALEDLTIDSCAGVSDLGWVATLPRLSALSAIQLDELDAMDGLSSTSLRELRIGGGKMRNAAAIGTLTGLEKLALSGLPRLRKLDFLNHLCRLRQLIIEDCPAPLPSLNLRELESVALGFGTKVRDLSPLRGLPLRYISLTGCAPDVDLSPLPAGCEVVR